MAAVMGSAEERERRAKAIRILSALRTGKPPHEEVLAIHVGWENLLDWFREKLSEIRDYGTSDVKFINADYGRGKSHFLDLVRLLAFERGFVVSRVELNQRDVPFDKLEIVVQRIVTGASTEQFRTNGFEQLLRTWARDRRARTEREVYAELDAVDMVQLRSKLVEYWKVHNSASPSALQEAALLKWFRGEETKSKTFPSVKGYLHGLTQFFRLIGYSGFVIMLDEAEAISSMTRGNRGEVANENIRQIIDNDQGTEGFYFLFASTPTFFDPPPGGQVRPGDPVSIYSYPALRRRVENVLGLMDPRSPDSVVVELPELEEDDYVTLARTIRDLTEQAYGSTPVTDSQLRGLVRYIAENEARVATLVRSAVAVCDRARRPNFDFARDFQVIVENQLDQFRRSASDSAATG